MLRINGTKNSSGSRSVLSVVKCSTELPENWLPLNFLIIKLIKQGFFYEL
jgi:hypothetical protein